MTYVLIWEFLAFFLNYILGHILSHILGKFRKHARSSQSRRYYIDLFYVQVIFMDLFYVPAIFKTQIILTCYVSGNIYNSNYIEQFNVQAILTTLMILTSGTVTCSSMSGRYLRCCDVDQRYG
jgi:hypothetical protein